MVKRENAITVDIVEALLLYETILNSVNTWKNEVNFFMAGSTRLRYFAASIQGNHCWKYGSTRHKHFTAQLLRLRLRLQV